MDFHPVVVDSKLLQGAECNYSILPKESLVLLNALHTCKSYIRESRFGTLLFTDCLALQYLRNNKNYSSSLYQLHLLLASFATIEVVYLRGVHNVYADLISRQAYSACIQDKEHGNPLIQSIALSLRNLVPEGAQLSPSDLQEFLLSETENMKIDVLHHPRVFYVKQEHFKRNSPFEMPRERQFLYIL